MTDVVVLGELGQRRFLGTRAEHVLDVLVARSATRAVSGPLAVILASATVVTLGSQ